MASGFAKTTMFAGEFIAPFSDNKVEVDSLIFQIQSEEKKKRSTNRSSIFLL